MNKLMVVVMMMMMMMMMMTYTAAILSHLNDFQMVFGL